MEKPNIKLQDGDVLSIKREERLVMGHETFKFENFWRALKQRLQVFDNTPKSQWLLDGVACDLLSPQKDWQKGKIRLVLEFIPDEQVEPAEMPPDQPAVASDVSPLDDIRHSGA